jgi:hypothetical protein
MFFGGPADRAYMGLWCEGVAESGLDQLLNLQVENRAWGKDLRRQIQVIVNSRLAKQISRDEYLANRSQNLEQATECRRRSDILNMQISRATAGDLRRT